MTVSPGNRIVTLGVKGRPSLRAGGTMPSPSLLQLDGQDVVIDAGPRVARGPVGAGVTLDTLPTICITHRQSAHILELGRLIRIAWVFALRTLIHVFDPIRVEACWKSFRQAMSCAIHRRVVDDGRFPLEFLAILHTLSQGKIAFGGLKVTALQVNHPPETFAYADRFAGPRTVTFSGNTVYHPTLGDLARGLDVLVHRALLPGAIDAILIRTGGREKLRQHLTAAPSMINDVGRVAGAAGIGKLVQNHLVPVDDPVFTDAMWQDRAAKHFAGPVIVIKDGLEVSP